MEDQLLLSSLVDEYILYWMIHQESNVTIFNRWINIKDMGALMALNLAKATARVLRVFKTTH